MAEATSSCEKAAWGKRSIAANSPIITGMRPFLLLIHFSITRPQLFGVFACVFILNFFLERPAHGLGKCGQCLPVFLEFLQILVLVFVTGLAGVGDLGISQGIFRQ